MFMSNHRVNLYILQTIENNVYGAINIHYIFYTLSKKKNVIDIHLNLLNYFLLFFKVEY